MYFASDYVYGKKRQILNAPIAAGISSSQAADTDTNVVSARFDQLVETSMTHAGDYYQCENANCDAVLSKLSKLSEQDPVTKKRTWACEFCNYENKLLIEKEEVPENDTITYIIEPPAAQTTETSSNVDSQYLIYCIDISGSMSVSTKVNGNFTLPTDEIRRESMRSIAGPDFQQSRVKYVTRLEAVQVAIEENLNKLEKNEPEKRVGLVTFNKNVNVIGDGKIDELEIRDDNLEQIDKLKEYVERTPELTGIKNNRAVLSNKLLNLEEGGATALGPALYYSVLLAARKRGSQVILCTDGLANRGIGSLEDDSKNDSEKFYNEIADFALANGVSVSIITIEGTNCKLGVLGDVSNKTGGAVNIVNPLNLKNEFSSILEEKVIATNVVVSLILHKGLYIIDHEDASNKLSKILKEVGNVTKETEITFEFTLRDDLDKSITDLPFQLKITYNALDGSKAMRVISQLKKVTDNKKIAEERSDRNILASHVAQTQTRLLKRNKDTTVCDQLSQYIREIKPLNDDGFSADLYDTVSSNLNNLRQRNITFGSVSNYQGQAVPPLSSNLFGSTTTPGCILGAPQSAQPQQNMFAMYNDSEASTAYKLSKISSKAMKKK